MENTECLDLVYFFCLEFILADKRTGFWKLIYKPTYVFQKYLDFKIDDKVMLL